VYRLVALVIDGAGNSRTTILGCVTVDKTPPVVAFTAFAGPSNVEQTPSGLLYTDSGDDLYSPIDAVFAVTEDLSPITSLMHCWGSNAFGTCDVTPRTTEVVSGGFLQATPTVSLGLSNPALRAGLDGVQVCAWLAASTSTSSSPRSSSSPCITLDFSPPLSGVVFDGPVSNVDRAFFGSTTGSVYATWTGFVDMGSGTIVGYEVSLLGTWSSATSALQTPCP
jgi:hypothetical protein